MGLALSTSWNAFRHTDGNSLVSEIKELGFGEIELSFNLLSNIVENIRLLVKNQQIKVTSLHNFCPIPDGLKREIALPDYYSLASLDEQERQKALKYTKHTIETARSLGAEAVVLHTGRVEITDRTRDLIDLFDRGLKDSREFNDLKSEAIRERDKIKDRFFESILKSLEELDLAARRSGILLGVETRFYYREIPNLEEIGNILEKFKGSQIRYWHDTGHAQLMENLGFCRHRDFLELSKGALLGIHLHNIVGCVDHHAPSVGEIDFRELLPYVTKDTLKVIEAHHPASAEQLKDSKKMLEVVFDEKV
jgi:sugar phosphate isomerase/epimerase